MSEIKTRYVGTSVTRVDSLEKVTGRAVYGVDIDLPGMLHGAVLRSSLPHAKVIDLDTSEAREAPGVRAVVTFSLGDVEKGFAESDEIFEDEFSAQALSHVTLESHAAVAQFSPLDGHYTVWSANDRPHRLHKELADALGIPVTHVRFIVPYVGGLSAARIP